MTGKLQRQSRLTGCEGFEFQSIRQYVNILEEDFGFTLLTFCIDQFGDVSGYLKFFYMDVVVP